jgi:hypothetical protein
MIRAVSLLLALVIPVNAWNATGHRVIAAIAYDHLTAQARAQADQLIRRHPDYPMFALNAPAEPRARARAAFVAASIWADQIRGDVRFYDESRPTAAPTPLLPGFPDMARHATWHYIDVPFSTDGTPLKSQPEPHALSEMRRILAELGAPGFNPSRQSYGLVWLLHIVGDVHQPLHCTSRFLTSQPDGDQGGNLVFVPPGRTLHALWDQAAGADSSDAAVNRLAAEMLSAALPEPASTDLDRWIREGFDLARSQVYTFGNATGTRELPVQLPSGYEENARRIARLQIVKAGQRLSEVLNKTLK